MKKLVVIRGGGELATGIAHRLHNTGFQVLMLEKAAPSAIRRDIVLLKLFMMGKRKWSVPSVPGRILSMMQRKC